MARLTCLVDDATHIHQPLGVSGVDGRERLHPGILQVTRERLERLMSRINPLLNLRSSQLAGCGRAVRTRYTLGGSYAPAWHAQQVGGFDQGDRAVAD